MNRFEARWTAQGHMLCLGEWQIRYAGTPLRVPPERRDQDMGTRGHYSFLYPDDPEFIEGLGEDDWILENMAWLADWFDQEGVPLDEPHLRDLYRAVNAQDWRCGSCGGCL